MLDILIGFVLGAVIGAGREWRGHPGGLRSCALVAAASSGFAWLMLDVGGNNMAAALGTIATGIGFLGAGVTMRRETVVRGLSTVATFWALAALGAGCGTRLYGAALGLFAVIVPSHVVLRPISARIGRSTPPDSDGPH